jgi:hypothetical protein
MLWAMAALIAAGGAGEQVFGDWAVDCDNGKRCQAVSLAPAGRRAAANRGDVTITREAGPAGAVTIAIRPAVKLSGIADVLIDGRMVASGVFRGDAVTLDGAEAEGLARAMADGHALGLRARGRMLGSMSLNGSSAMLRWIDAQQGRAGGITALVAKGTRSAALVPAPTALPRVAGVRPPKGPARGALPAMGALDCDARGGFGAEQPVQVALDRRAVLALMPCGGSPENPLRMAFVVRGGKATPAPFDRPPAVFAGMPIRGPGVMNYAWDNGVLESRYLGTAKGDCGVRQRWAWDGAMFRLIEMAELETCRGAAGWIGTYRASVGWK